MKANTARALRTWHRYIALFFAPAIIFFSLSGALQTIGLHESHGDQPPAAVWIRWMASVHKDQRVVLAARPPGARPKQSEAGPPASDGRGAEEHRDAGPSPIPLKAFVLLLSLGLMTSSALGIAIGLASLAYRRNSLIAVALGILVPVALALV